MSETVYVVGEDLYSVAYIGTDEDDAKEAARGEGNVDIKVFEYGSLSREVEATKTFDLSGHSGSIFVVGSDASCLSYVGEDEDDAKQVAIDEDEDTIYVYSGGTLDDTVEAETDWDL